MVAALELSVDPNDTVLTPQRLDLAAMKTYHFATANSSTESLVYRMLFTDGDEREIPLPQPTLFSICTMPWLCSKEEVDEQLHLLGFHGQHQGMCPLTTTLRTMLGRPRVRIRMKALLRRITEALHLG